MTDNTDYPEGFPLHGAFFIHDIQRKSWWPYRPIDGVVDALWLLGDDAKPEGLFGQLMTKWGEAMDWFIAGSSYFQPDAEPSSWTAQHKVQTRMLLGSLTYQDGFPFHRYMEWWQITPSAQELHNLIQGPLLHPGGGWWMAASAPLP